MQHYFFYNRLMDYWHNKTIITKQLQQMKAKARLLFVTVYTALCMYVHYAKLQVTLSKHVHNYQTACHHNSI